MPDEDKVDGSLGNEPIDKTGASTDGDLSEGDQGADKGKAQEDAIAKTNKRIDDMRSQYDRRLDEAAQREAKLLAVIESGAQAKSTQADQQAAQEAKADLIRQYDEGEITGERFYALLEGIAQDARDAALAETGEKLTAAEQERKELREKLAALETNTDPAYVANKAKVDEVVQKYGVTRDVAMKIVADMKPSQPARPDVAGGLGGIGVTGGDDGAGDSRVNGIVAGLAAHVTGRKPTEAAMKKHNQKWGKK